MHIGKRSKAWHRSSSQYHYEVRIKKQNQRGRLRRSSQRGWREVRICPMLETKLRKGLKGEEAIDWVNVTDRPNEMIRKWSLNLITWRLLGSWKSKVVLVKWLKRTSTWASLTQRKRTGDTEDRQHFQRVLTGKVGQQNGTVATRERGVHGEVSLFFRLRIMNDLVHRGGKKKTNEARKKKRIAGAMPLPKWEGIGSGGRLRDWPGRGPRPLLASKGGEVEAAGRGHTVAALVGVCWRLPTSPRKLKQRHPLKVRLGEGGRAGLSQEKRSEIAVWDCGKSKWGGNGACRRHHGATWDPTHCATQILGSKTRKKLSSLLYSILEKSKPIKLELLVFHGVASDQSIEENWYAHIWYKR